MQKQSPILTPSLRVEQITEISTADLHDLCDATEAAIEAGGGFGWVDIPERDTMERFWQGVITIPARLLFVSRMDGVICGTAQIMLPPINNEAQNFAAKMLGVFVAPWARGYGLSRMLLKKVEDNMRERGIDVINLNVRETMHSAITLFESAGYERIGVHPYYARVDGEMLKGYYYTKIIRKNGPSSRPVSVE